MSSIDFFTNPYGVQAPRNRSSYAMPARSDIFSRFQGPPRSDVFVSQSAFSANKPGFDQVGVSQAGLNQPGWNKPGWFRSFATAGAGYAAGRQLLQTAGIQQQPAGWLTHLGRVGVLTAGVKTLGSYNPFARTSNEVSEPSSPDWLMNLLTFGSTMAGLLFLCKRFDFAALLNASSSALSTLRGLPVFSRLRQALNKLQETPAIKPNPAFPSKPAFV